MGPQELPQPLTKEPSQVPPFLLAFEERSLVPKSLNIGGNPTLLSRRIDYAILEHGMAPPVRTALFLRAR